MQQMPPVAAKFLAKMSGQLYSHRVVRSRCDYGFVVISSSLATHPVSYGTLQG